MHNKISTQTYYNNSSKDSNIIYNIILTNKLYKELVYILYIGKSLYNFI